jgi:hypothetical protein
METGVGGGKWGQWHERRELAMDLADALAVSRDEGQRPGADLDAQVGRGGGLGLDDRGVADEEVGMAEHPRGGVGQDELPARHFGRGSGEALAIGGDEEDAALGGEEDAVEDVAAGIGGGAGGDLGERLERLLGQRVNPALNRRGRSA